MERQRASPFMRAALFPIPCPFGTCMLQLSSASAAGGGHWRQSSGATMPCWVCAQAIEFHGRMRRRESLSLAWRVR